MLVFQPHLTFNFKTDLDPTRKTLMETFCSITAEGTDYGWDQDVVSWEKICELARTGKFEESKICWWSEDLGDYDAEYQECHLDGDNCFGMTELYYNKFFSRLFSRHRKYSERDIEFVDAEAHARFMNIDIKEEGFEQSGP